LKTALHEKQTNKNKIYDIAKKLGATIDLDASIHGISIEDAEEKSVSTITQRLG